MNFVVIDVEKCQLTGPQKWLVNLNDYFAPINVFIRRREANLNGNRGSVFFRQTAARYSLSSIGVKKE
jgi:hypothetical protein